MMKHNQVRDIHISIVSHGQLELVDLLLSDLSLLTCANRLQITVTFNTHDDNIALINKHPLFISCINNEMIKGFSANHNYAFKFPPAPNERKYFIVLNPDIRITEDVITDLVYLIDKDRNIGVISPAVINTEGELEDSARELPTYRQLLYKLLGKRCYWNHIDSKTRYCPDWVAGMFMVFKVDIFDRIGGFDEGFFLYYEDVDICSRLWLNGLSVQVNPLSIVMHDARRDSRRKLKYFYWHLVSMYRFFTSKVHSDAIMAHTSRCGNRD